MQKKLIVLTGGGTGGHIYPNLAIATEIAPFCEIAYIGSNGGLEEVLATSAGLNFHGIPTAKLQRKICLENFKLPYKLAKSTNLAKQILKKLRPTVVFAKGGYVSLPVCLAALSLKIPVLCHESDFSVGLANKIAYRRGAHLLTSFKTTYAGKKRVLLIGSPIRREVCKSETSKNKQQSKNTNKQQPTLLIIGGSQGAENINNAVIKNLQKLTSRFEIFHLTGKGKSQENFKLKEQFSSMAESEFDFMMTKYHQIEYCKDMKELYQKADIAVSRGGANALFELLEWEIPTLCVPLSKGSRGDQVENAIYLSNTGVCHMLSESHLFGFFEAVCVLFDNRDTIVENIVKTKLNAPFNGTENIAKLLLSY